MYRFMHFKSSRASNNFKAEDEAAGAGELGIQGGQLTFSSDEQENKTMAQNLGSFSIFSS